MRIPIPARPTPAALAGAAPGNGKMLVELGAGPVFVEV